LPAREIRANAPNEALDQCINQLMDSFMVGAIAHGRTDRLRIGGSDPGLARSLVRGIHTALFGK
jgi:hypothetical protein